jgi:hypothetical protein
MNSMPFSFPANSNSKVDGNQIHRPTLTPVFASLDHEMDTTIRSLNFHVGSSGSIRLSDPTKLNPSAGKTMIMVILESSVGSSSEVNSLVSFTTTENIEDKIEELDKTMENLDLGKQSEDFMICCGSNSDKSTDTWKIGLELHEDNQTTLSSCSSKFDNQYQILAILGDNLEEFDDNNNPVLNPANMTRGANHLAEGDTADSLTNREKFSYHSMSGIESKQQLSTVHPSQRTQAKRYFWGITTPFDDNQDSRRKKEAKYEKGGTQQLQQAQLCMKRATTHHIQTAEGTPGMARESTTSSTQIDETSPETLTHLSCRSMSKAISCQKHPKQHSWQHKHICIPHSQTWGTQENTCIEQHYRV